VNHKPPRLELSGYVQKVLNLPQESDRVRDFEKKAEEQARGFIGGLRKDSAITSIRAFTVVQVECLFLSKRYYKPLKTILDPFHL
jgi:hypothetical protein